MHPVTVLVIEYSLAYGFIEAEILPTAPELGIGIMPDRVLANRLLTGEPPQGPRRRLGAPQPKSALPATVQNRPRLCIELACSCALCAAQQSSSTTIW